jgi:hypothetical protein
VPVDFVERIFHASPDQGSGITEIAFWIVLLLIPVLAAIRRKRTNHRIGTDGNRRSLGSLRNGPAL